MASAVAIGLMINNIALVTVSTDFLLAQHLRKVRLIWDVNDKAQQTVDLKPLDDGEPPIRLRILGASYILGQCIGPPQALRDELGLEGPPTRASRAVHTGTAGGVEQGMKGALDGVVVAAFLENNRDNKAPLNSEASARPF
jgi:hypothetical protein